MPSPFKKRKHAVAVAHVATNPRPLRRLPLLFICLPIRCKQLLDNQCKHTCSKIKALQHSVTFLKSFTTAILRIAPFHLHQMRRPHDGGLLWMQILCRIEKIYKLETMDCRSDRAPRDSGVCSMQEIHAILEDQEPENFLYISELNFYTSDLVETRILCTLTFIVRIPSIEV